MKSAKSLIVLVSILMVLSIFGFIALYRAGYMPGGLDVFIFALIIVSGTYAFVTHMKQQKDASLGFPTEDELSTRIKYKAGYFSFIASMYIWLIVFLLARFFPDTESMLGSGILLSAFVAIVIKSYLTRNYDENQN
jgi:hypothetical protein